MPLLHMTQPQSSSPLQPPVQCLSQVKRAGLGLDRKQAGISLLEVLVALMVLVFSLLGVAAVQLRLEQFTQSAIARSQSSNAITDLIEKMRANRKVAIDTRSYDTDFSSTPAICNAPDLQVSYADLMTLNSAATPAQLAQAEVLQLKRELACLLPLGTLKVVSGQATTASNTSCTPTLIAAAPDVMTIIVKYDDRKGDLNAAQAAQANGTQPPQYRCFTEVVQL